MKSHAENLAENVSAITRDALVLASRLPVDDALREKIRMIAHFHGPMVIAFREEIARRERVIARLRNEMREAAVIIKGFSERKDEPQ